MASKLIPASIEALQDHLSSEGYETAIQPATELNPSEHLLVSLAKNQEGHDLIARLFWSQDYRSEEPENIKEQAPQFLQFFILFPFLVAESAVQDTTKLILNLNATFDMANFGLYESQRLIYYRYVHVHPRHKIDAETVSAVIVSIEFLLDMLMPSLTEIALGKKTLKEVEAEALEKVRKSDLDFL